VPESAPAVFVSYSRADSEFALKLVRDLKAAGISVWLDQLDIIPGQVWDREIEAAVVISPCMLVILSPTSVISDDVANEFNYALDERKIVIPVLHRDCPVPFRLRRRQYADFRQDYGQGLQDIQRALAPSEDARRAEPANVDVGEECSSNNFRAVMSQARPVRRRYQAGSHALLVTLHGGPGSGKMHNIHAYDEDGNRITSSV